MSFVTGCSFEGSFEHSLPTELPRQKLKGLVPSHIYCYWFHQDIHTVVVFLLCLPLKMVSQKTMEVRLS